jgi:hypothetical protein
LAGLELLILVEGVEESDLDQVGGPDHGSGVDKVATEDTGHTVTQHLCAENEEEVGEETVILTIPDLLDDSDIDGVGGATSAVGGQGNQDVLLDGEGTGVKGTSGEDTSQELAERIRQQLDDQGGDGHRASTEPEELIEEGEDAREEDGHEPETSGHDGERGVILVGDNGGNLGNRRVLLLLEDDGRALDIELLVDEFFFSSVFLLLLGHGGGGEGGGWMREEGLSS